MRTERQERDKREEKCRALVYVKDETDKAPLIVTFLHVSVQNLIPGLIKEIREVL